MSLKNRLESDYCRGPCHCPSTQDSETAVDGWVSGGDPCVVEFVYFSFFVAVLVVTAYTYFNVPQRQAQRGLELRTRVRFHGLETRTVSVMIRCTRTGTPSRRTCSRHFNGDVYSHLCSYDFGHAAAPFVSQLAKGGHVDHSMDSGGADDEPFRRDSTERNVHVGSSTQAQFSW